MPGLVRGVPATLQGLTWLHSRGLRRKGAVWVMAHARVGRHGGTVEPGYQQPLA